MPDQRGRRGRGAASVVPWRRPFRPQGRPPVQPEPLLLAVPVDPSPLPASSWPPQITDITMKDDPLSFFGAALAPPRGGGGGGGAWERRRSAGSGEDRRPLLLSERPPTPLLRRSHQLRHADEGPVRTVAAATVRRPSLRVYHRRVAGLGDGSDDDEGDGDGEDALSVLLRFSRWYDAEESTSAWFCGGATTTTTMAPTVPEGSSNDDGWPEWIGGGFLCTDEKPTVSPSPSPPQTKRHRRRRSSVARRRVSWADDAGQPLTTVHVVDHHPRPGPSTGSDGPDDDDLLAAAARTCCLLLLAPRLRQYELVVVRWLAPDRLPVRDFLRRLPRLATPGMAPAQERYARLYRVVASAASVAPAPASCASADGRKDSPEGKTQESDKQKGASPTPQSKTAAAPSLTLVELIHATRLQDYDLQPWDVLVAVPEDGLVVDGLPVVQDDQDKENRDPLRLAGTVRALLTRPPLRRALRYHRHGRYHHHHAATSAPLLVSAHPPELVPPICGEGEVARAEAERLRDAWQDALRRQRLPEGDDDDDDMDADDDAGSILNTSGVDAAPLSERDDHETDRVTPWTQLSELLVASASCAADHVDRDVTTSATKTRSLRRSPRHERRDDAPTTACGSDAAASESLRRADCRRWSWDESAANLPNLS